MFTALDDCTGLISLTGSPLYSDPQQHVVHCGCLITFCLHLCYILIYCKAVRNEKENVILKSLSLSLLDHSPQELWVIYIHKSSDPVLCRPWGLNEIDARGPLYSQQTEAQGSNYHQPQFTLVFVVGQLGPPSSDNVVILSCCKWSASCA